MGKKVTRRNFWHPNEIRCMLQIFKELKALHLIEQKILPVNDIYRGIQHEMIRQGYDNKTARQIQSKWSQLKSTYLCAKRNHNPDFYLMKDLEFRDEVRELVESQQENITPLTTINTAVFMDSYFDNRFEKELEEKEQFPDGENSYKQGSYKKTFWKFMQNLKSVEKDIQDEFIARQRSMLASERILQMERNNQIINAFARSTNSILKTSNYLLTKAI